MSFIPSVESLNNAHDRALFDELVSVYIRLVEVFCEKNKIDLAQPLTDWDSIVNEFIKIGFIEQEPSISKLKKYLSEKYLKLENAVNIQLKYKDTTLPVINCLRNDTRKALQKDFCDRTKYTIADFFCGAGGLSLGFRRMGYNIKLANDIEEVCIDTYKFNHPEIPEERVVHGSIENLINDIDTMELGPIDVVVGGPPCQGFSEANRQRVIDDPRNKLYKFYLNAIEKIAPKFVVMENVKGMLKVSNQIIEDYRKISVCIDGVSCSYLVNCRLLNSLLFSVAQSRERLIFVAIREDIAKRFSITPDYILDQIELLGDNARHYLLSDALSDIKSLSAPRTKNMTEIDSEECGKKIDVNSFEVPSNSYIREINQNRCIPYVFNHKARYCSDVNYEIYKRLAPGEDATNEKIKDIMPYAHRNHCFKDKYFKLYPDRPCRTITAHLKMDCHSHIHPTQTRSLTPREAARVQSFPDDYFFLGAYLKTYMQIGNAVPPLMAQGIASVIKKYLE